MIEMPEKDSATRIVCSGGMKSEKTVILQLTPNPTKEVMRFYSHQNAYAAFVVWNGRFLFFNGEKTEQLCRGDFIFIPPVNSFYFWTFYTRSLSFNRFIRGLFMAINH
jgi:mannose-6-phosphate isomerase-like protein (cupin superfamily)